jgi:hypothetical protein
VSKEKWACVPNCSDQHDLILYCWIRRQADDLPGHRYVGFNAAFCFGLRSLVLNHHSRFEALVKRKGTDAAMKQVQKKQQTEPRTIELTLTAENTEALADYEFWTGKSAQHILRIAFLEWMECLGKDHLWDIARDPKLRAKAFARNKLNAKSIASCNASLDATFDHLRKETVAMNAKVGLATPGIN